MAILERISPFESQDAIRTFYKSLSTEKETFQLPLDSILKSYLLYVVWDSSQNIQALAGLRKKVGASVFFVVVKEEFQGKGLGKQLTEKCFESLSVLNPILLTVEKGNKKAQHLYESLGMKVISADQNRVIMLKARGPLSWIMRFFLFWIRPRLD